jgi:hypothetical protein
MLRKNTHIETMGHFEHVCDEAAKLGALKVAIQSFFCFVDFDSVEKAMQFIAAVTPLLYGAEVELNLGRNFGKKKAEVMVRHPR